MSSQKFEDIMHRVFEATGISSQIELASILDLNRSAISRAKQRAKVPERWIDRVCEIFDLDPEWIKNGRSIGERFLEVPIVKAKLGAGGGSYLVDAEVNGHVAFRSNWLHRKGSVNAMVLMQVIGDSMEPLIQEGDYVLIDQSQQEIYAGGLYALGLDETIMVKRVEKHPHELLILSANPNYSPISLKGDEIETVRVIGRVVGMWRDFH